MTPKTRRIVRLAPRILCVAFTLFISLFALDVFTMGLAFRETLVALLMHLIPTYVLIAMLLLAWRWEWIGALISAALGTLFLWWNFTYRHNVLIAVLSIAGPLYTMAALYLFNWVKRDELRPPSGA